jgi:hypothetical protein
LNPAGIANPGYAKPPSAVQYYFGGRGIYRLDSISSTDLNVTYSIPITKVSLFVKADLFNVFDQHGVENVEAAPTSGIGAGVGAVINKTVRILKSFNPYTETPVECARNLNRATQCAGTNYQLDPAFGTPTNKDAYQLPRTYRFAVGLRF